MHRRHDDMERQMVLRMMSRVVVEPDSCGISEELRTGDGDIYLGIMILCNGCDYMSRK